MSVPGQKFFILRNARMNESFRLASTTFNRDSMMSPKEGLQPNASKKNIKNEATL